MFFETRRHKNSKIKNFQVFGERSSGTNFTRRLVASNLGIPHTDAYGWKHGYPGMLSVSRDSLLVIVFRSVTPWLKSMYAKPWHTTPAMRELDFSDFIRSEWRTLADIPGVLPKTGADSARNEPLQTDRHPMTGRPFHNIIELRNVKNACFLGMRDRECNVALAQFEYVSSDPAGFLGALSKAFGIEFSGSVTPVDKHLGKGNFPDTRIAPDVLPEGDLSFISENLDFEIETQLGFKYDFQRQHPRAPSI